MQELIFKKLSKVRILLFQRSLRKVPSAQILSALFPSCPRGEIQETGSKSVFPSGAIEYCYSIEVRQHGREEIN